MGDRWDDVPPRIRADAVAAGATHAWPADWPAPCSLDEGLTWARAMLAQGFYLDHRIEHDIVWFKLWEYGEDEPGWDTVIPADRPIIRPATRSSRGRRWFRRGRPTD